MERLVRGDIAVIDFPFSDLKNVKRRPVLILKVPKGEDIIVAQITASSYEKSVEIPLEKNSFRVGGLKRKSFVRMDKIASIEKSLVKYKAGSLKHEKFEEVLNKIVSFFVEN